MVRKTKTNVVDLNGTPIKPRRLKRNQFIHEVLSLAQARNDEGATEALIVIALTEDGRSRHSFHWKSEKDFMALLGAVDMVKHSMIMHAVGYEEEVIGDGG